MAKRPSRQSLKSLIEWHFKPFCAGNTNPARVWRAPRLATDDEEAVTVVAEGAILDPKVSDLGCKSKLVSIKKCEFSDGKTNDSMVLGMT